MASDGHSYLPRATHIKGAKAEHWCGALPPAGSLDPRRFLALCAAHCAAWSETLKLSLGEGERPRLDERSRLPLSDAGARP